MEQERPIPTERLRTVRDQMVERFSLSELRDLCFELGLNWDQLAQPHQTVVFYMGLVGLALIVEQLLNHGVSPDMPIALIQQGTTPHQRVFSGTLATIQEVIAEEKPQPPTLIIVGEVVKLREKLNWFQNPAQSDQRDILLLPPSP